MSTLKDVAQKAGVTVTTVSRVINNRGYISEKTRKKVFDVMEEIGYQPNEVARSLSKQHTNTIGVIVPHIVHPYFAKLLSNIESVATTKGYKMLVCNSKDERSNERKHVEMFKSNQVVGIIICSGRVSVHEFLDLHIPVVTIECADDSGDCNIQCDNYMGGVLATEHLIQCGCREIVHFSGVEKQVMPANVRGNGFKDVCQKNKIKYHVVETSEASYNVMEYMENIRDTLAKYPMADGIFASSDVIAAQSIQACSALGKRVPQEVKIVGFDDVNIATLVNPMLTTIRQPIKEMAQLAVETIIKNRDGHVMPSKVVLPVTLIERGSTCRI
jgi:LacI family sucrose operon transcriptional repressor